MIAHMIAYTRRPIARIRRWARRELCRRMRSKRSTPDAVLRYLARTCGDAETKLIAAYLD